MFSFAPAILTQCARGNITECLPWEILESICSHCEDAILEDEGIAKEASDRYFASNPVPEPKYEASLAAIDMPSNCHFWPEVPLAKHRKNLFILSMTHICRSWRLRLVEVKRLWREIAFSADPKVIGIRLATHFLTKVADDDTPLHIYVGLPFGDAPNPAVMELLSKLFKQTHRWEIFVYWGRLGPYRPYLDLPAPNLWHFSDSNDLSHIYFGQPTQLFAGYTPILRSLVTSALGSWQSVNLTNLQTLDLWDCAPGFSIESLLSVLRRTPQLEGINIVSPNPPLLDCPLDEVVNLPHLKNLKIQNPDFYAIIGYFAIPNAKTVSLYSSSNRGSGGSQLGRAFQIAHPFVGFPSMTNSLPMFGQPILFSSLGVAHAPQGLRLVISITTENGAFLRVDLEWTGGFGVDARSGYIRRSMSALADMPFLSSSLLYITASPYLINYDSPLFRLDTIEHLIVEGERFTTIINALSRPPGRSQLLPKLINLFFPEDELDREMVDEIPKLLRSRKNLVIVVGTENRDLTRGLSCTCSVEGEFAFLKTASFFTRINLLFTERTALVPTQGVYPMIYIHHKHELA